MMEYQSFFLPLLLLGMLKDSPNWLDDWTDLGVQTSKGDLDVWLSHPISVPISPVMQHGELVSLEKQMVVQHGHGPVSQHEDDLAVVFWLQR